MPGEVSLVGLVNVILRRRRLVLGLATGFAFAVGLLTLLAPPEYSAESTFMPQVSQQALPGLSGVAAQFGLDVGGAATGEPSLALFEELVRTFDLLDQAVTTEYRFPIDEEGSDTVVATLVDLYDVEGDAESERVAAAVKKLREHIATVRDAEASLVHLTTRARWPALATAVNRRLLDLLEAFNLERRQSQAAAEREFIEHRMERAQQELLDAEDRLQAFLERNRTWQGSSELEFQYARLQRRVDLRQRVYSSLAESYEQSRIEEVRNTPVFTVVDSPKGNVRDVTPSTVVNAVLAGIAGAVLGIIVAFLVQQFSDQRRWHPEEYDEFERLRRTAVRDLVPRRRETRS